VRSCVIGLVLVLAVASAAAAQREVDETKPARRDGRVEINNVKGSVHVVGWDQDEVRVKGKLGRGVERLDFESNHRRTIVRVVYPREGWLRRSEPSHLTVHVPVGSSVVVDAVGADVSAEEILGPLDLESVSGDVKVSNAGSEVRAHTTSGDVGIEIVAGALEADSVSGDIRVRRAASDVRARTVSGDIEMDHVPAEREAPTGDTPPRGDALPRGAEIDAVSVSGDIVIAGALLREVECESVSGSIRVDGSFVPDGEVRLNSHSGDVKVRADKLRRVTGESMSGDVRLEAGTLARDASVRLEAYSGSISMTLREDIAGRVDLHTFSGRISTDIEGQLIGYEHAGPGKRVSATVGSGDAKIWAKTLSGNISVRTR
jgi:DUF4097 and DUF4098 domain-containing protein YvlB